VINGGLGGGEVIPPTAYPSGTITSLTSTGGTITIASPTGPVTNIEASSSTGVASFNGRTGAVFPATSDYTVSQVTGAAALASPTFTGVPAAPTAAALTSTTQLATTAFATSAIAAASALLVPLTEVGANSGVAALSATGSVLTPVVGDTTTSVAAGVAALRANVSGSLNVALGYFALASNTTGASNVAIGATALSSVTTVGSLTAIGYAALAANTTGVHNNAVGNNALAAYIGGQDNTAQGFDALQHNTSGSQNTATGSLALNANVTVTGLTAVGYGAMFSNTAGLYGTAVGYQALFNWTGAGGASNYMTAIGYNALTSFTAGNQSNVAVGSNALKSLVSGGAMTAIGDGALMTSVTGGDSVAVGFYALNVSTGGGNTAVGSECLQLITTGTDNTAIGCYAGFGTGAGQSPNASVTSVGSTFVGAFSLPGDTSDPAYVTTLGYQTTVIGWGSVAIGTDHTGAGAAATLQDQIKLGTVNHTVYEAATNTASGATASTPTIANTATGVQVNATKDTMLYLTCSTLGTGFTLKIGPTSTPANTVVNNLAVTVGDCFSVRVPGGWYVSWVATSAAFANQLAVTC